MALKTVIDTNVLVASLSSRSSYHWLIQNLLDGHIELYLTTEIFLEYEEILKRKYSVYVATNFLTALKELSNVFFVHVHFKWDLLSDKDDNKFVDCYVAARAEYLVTNDSDFNMLQSVQFPSVNVISLSDFQTHL
jgi:uncharacterized protein